MKIFFKETEKVVLYRGCQIIKRLKKQSITDFLMGKYDKVKVDAEERMDRMMIMSFLPYLSAIGFEYPGYDLKKNQIIFWFESSSLCNPSPVILEVDDRFYEFLQSPYSN